MTIRTRLAKLEREAATTISQPEGDRAAFLEALHRRYNDGDLEAAFPPVVPQTAAEAERLAAFRATYEDAQRMSEEANP